MNFWFDTAHQQTGRETIVKTEKFARKPFVVDGVQVTAENMQEVAEWCNSEVREVRQARKNQPEDDRKEAGTLYVKVRVLRPLSERQTMAFVGDWVLYAGTGYKVYTNKAFRATFDPAAGHYDQVFTPQPGDDELPVFKEAVTGANELVKG